MMLNREQIIRVISGVGVAALIGYLVLYTGVYNSDGHIPMYELFFVAPYSITARLIWVILTGATAAGVGALASVGLRNGRDPVRLTLLIAALAIGAIVLVVTVQQITFTATLSPGEDAFLLVENIGYFLLVSAVPTFLVALLLNAILGFTRPRRSAVSIMPQELLHEHEQAARH